MIVEKRNYIAGNAYDEFDEHGILAHRYGQHILHTNSKEVFDFINLGLLFILVPMINAVGTSIAMIIAKVFVNIKMINQVLCILKIPY